MGGLLEALVGNESGFSKSEEMVSRGVVSMAPLLGMRGGASLESD